MAHEQQSTEEDGATERRATWQPPWRRRRIGPTGRLLGMEGALNWVELSIYAVAGLLLTVAGALTLVGTIIDVVEGSKSRRITDTGVFLLDRILLLLILAELLYTLRLVGFSGRMLVEPFLFIALIAVVRRILVVTAEADLDQSGEALEDFLIEIGAMAALVLVLAIAIALLRRSAAQQP
ncbi:MAG: hypothetical protein QOE95_2381 [Gaiellaceae bacterium]|nr:hypothetical protein [Gaiellaceae bacterium]